MKYLSILVFFSCKYSCDQRCTHTTDLTQTTTAISVYRLTEKCAYLDIFSTPPACDTLSL